MATQILSRLSVAGTVKPGNTVEARWIVGHPMETGFRLDDSGQRIPRNIITAVRVRLNGKLILEIEPGTGLSAHPYLAFPVVVPEGGGTLVVDWVDDRGQSGQVQHILLLSK